MVHDDGKILRYSGIGAVAHQQRREKKGWEPQMKISNKCPAPDLNVKLVHTGSTRLSNIHLQDYIITIWGMALITSLHAFTVTTT